MQGREDMNGRMEDRKEKAIEIWLANPLADLQTIAAKAGISDKTFYRYRQDAAFMDEYHNRLKQRFAALEGKAMFYLEDQIDAKNWNAIKYVLDSAGYKPTEKVDMNATTTINVSIGDD